MKNLINSKLNHIAVLEFIKKYELDRLNNISEFGQERVKRNNYHNTGNSIGLNINKETRKIESVYFEKGKEELSKVLLNITLLFGIRFKDTMEEVASKIGVESTLIHQNKEQNIVWDKVYHHTYFIDEIAVRIWFNTDKQLISFSYSVIDDFYKEHFQWKNTLSNQKLNRKIDIEDLKQQSPISIWKERLKENEILKQQNSADYIEDYWYTTDRLEQIEDILDIYLKKLKENCFDNKPIKVEQSLRDAILRVNEFNQTTNMIETDEREELCPFFDKTISATGIELPKNFDPTLIYREW